MHSLMSRNPSSSGFATVFKNWYWSRKTPSVEANSDRFNPNFNTLCFQSKSIHGYHYHLWYRYWFISCEYRACAEVPGVSYQLRMRHCISLLDWLSTDLILGAGAAGADTEWTCFSVRMSHLGLDTLWCLKHTLKCDTPSTYLLAAHNNLSAGC